jgi:glycerol kinase
LFARLFENVPETETCCEQGRLLFGTVDTWLLWNLTGGLHLTDVTNASRTMLMNLETLEWDPFLCKLFGVPSSILPRFLFRNIRLFIGLSRLLAFTVIVPNSKNYIGEFRALHYTLSYN